MCCCCFYFLGLQVESVGAVVFPLCVAQPQVDVLCLLFPAVVGLHLSQMPLLRVDG